MAHFASRNGAFCNAENYPLNISHYYSIFYKNLLFFAYLSPKTTQSANTRLFFGVESETQTEKSESGYDLKVLRCLPCHKNIALRIHFLHHHSLLMFITVEFLKKWDFAIYLYFCFVGSIFLLSLRVWMQDCLRYDGRHANPWNHKTRQVPLIKVES